MDVVPRAQGEHESTVARTGFLNIILVACRGYVRWEARDPLKCGQMCPDLLLRSSFPLLLLLRYPPTNLVDLESDRVAILFLARL
jgi:hypothetical protein